MDKDKSRIFNQLVQVKSISLSLDVKIITPRNWNGQVQGIISKTTSWRLQDISFVKIIVLPYKTPALYYKDLGPYRIKKICSV